MCQICKQKYNKYTNSLDLYNCKSVNCIYDICNPMITQLYMYKLQNVRSLSITMINLTELYLYYIPITVLPDTYINLSILDIIGCPIGYIPESYTNLVDLSIQETNITTIPTICNKLTKLSINQSPVSVLPYYPKLKYLLTYRSLIDYIPEDYGETLEGLNISLSRNHSHEKHIRVLQDYLRSLKYLYATTSTISYIPESYTSLEVCIIDDTNIYIISPKLVNIRVLSCTCTKIKTIQKELVLLEELTYNTDETDWDNSNEKLIDIDVDELISEGAKNAVNNYNTNYVLMKKKKKFNQVINCLKLK